MTTRKQQAKKTKQRLLEAAKNLIAANGYENTKIEDICQIAQVSVGAFYHHFDEKGGEIFKCKREKVKRLKRGLVALGGAGGQAGCFLEQGTLFAKSRKLLKKKEAIVCIE